MNLVNAEMLARERGIEIAESSNPKKGDFASLLHAEVETEQGTAIAAGTLFGDQYVRLVQLGPYRMEGYLDGVLLVFTHRDVPGHDRFHRHDLRNPSGQHRADDGGPAGTGR